MSKRIYENVLIVLGDTPFWKPETLKKIESEREKDNFERKRKISIFF